MKIHTRYKGKTLSQVLYALSLVCLAIGLFALGWVVWPAPTDARQFIIPAGPLPAASGETRYASYSAYSLEINWPRWLRSGETGTIHLRLTDLDHEPIPAGETREGQVVLAEPALYPLRLDPPGSTQANIADEQDLVLFWEVTGEQPGEIPGKMFVSFGFYDEDLDELVPVPVAVVDFEIKVIDLWGLDSGLVIWLGLVGLVVWGALFVLGRVAGVAYRS